MSVHANWNRRKILAGAAATIAAPSVLRAQGLSGTITLMSYAGIFLDNYQRRSWSRPEAHPGVKVNYAPGGTSAQMLGTIRAQKADPQVDVVIFDVTTSGIGNIEGLFSRMSPEEVPSLNDLDRRPARPGAFRPGRDSTIWCWSMTSRTSIRPWASSPISGVRSSRAGGARCAPQHPGTLALTAMVRRWRAATIRSRSIPPSAS